MDMGSACLVNIIYQLESSVAQGNMNCLQSISFNVCVWSEFIMDLVELFYFYCPNYREIELALSILYDLIVPYVMRRHYMVDKETRFMIRNYIGTDQKTY